MRAPAIAACLAALLLLPAGAPASVSTGGTGWFWANPLPQGNDLDTVAFVGAHGVAVGADGVVVRTEDAGATWSASVSRTEANLTEVAMPDANTVYAGGGCVLRRSTDGGATFQRVAFTARESRCSAKLAQIAFPTPTTGYLILTDGTVLRTANAGRSFARRAHLGVGSSVPQEGAADAVFTSENTGVISTGLFGPAFLRTEDGGQSWTRITPVDGNGYPTFTRVRSVRFLTPLLGYAVSDTPTAPMAKTEDGGLTWTPLPLAGASGSPQGIDCADANTCVIVAATNIGGPANRLTWTADGGVTGTTITPPGNLVEAKFTSADARGQRRPGRGHPRQRRRRPHLRARRGRAPGRLLRPAPLRRPDRVCLRRRRNARAQHRWGEQLAGPRHGADHPGRRRVVPQRHRRLPAVRGRSAAAHRGQRHQLGGARGERARWPRPARHGPRDAAGGRRQRRPAIDGFRDDLRHEGHRTGARVRPCRLRAWSPTGPRGC